jgi:hypothetical protein
MEIKDDLEFKYYPIIFAILLIVSFILNYFNLTFNFTMKDLIKIDILITSLIYGYFKNKEWFKVVFSIMILLGALMIFVDFLERNVYFGLGSPNALRLILVVGGSTVIIVGTLTIFKRKRSELK